MTDLAPFHIAFPVDDLDAARHFYGHILGCAEGRSSADWIDFNLYGHQIVAHRVDTPRAAAVTKDTCAVICGISSPSALATSKSTV